MSNNATITALEEKREQLLNSEANDDWYGIVELRMTERKIREMKREQLVSLFK